MNTICYFKVKQNNENVFKHIYNIVKYIFSFNLILTFNLMPWQIVEIRCLNIIYNCRLRFLLYFLCRNENFTFFFPLLFRRILESDSIPVSVQVWRRKLILFFSTHMYTAHIYETKIVHESFAADFIDGQ